MAGRGPFESTPNGHLPRRQFGCLGCLGYLVVLAGLVLLGFWGYGKYQAHQAALAESEREREITEAIKRHALLNPKMGLDYLFENMGRSNPHGDPDRDGLSNERELALGTALDDPDTDKDGLTDGDEVSKFHSNPLQESTAGDGVSDLVKVLENRDPRTRLATLPAPYQVEYRELGVALRTSDPNSKHLHQVEPFQSQLVDTIDSVREPVIIRSFKGEVTITYPDTAPDQKKHQGLLL